MDRKLICCLSLSLALNACGACAEANDAVDAMELSGLTFKWDQERILAPRTMPSPEYRQSLFYRYYREASALQDPATQQRYLIGALEEVPKMNPAIRKEADRDIQSAIFGLIVVAGLFADAKKFADQEYTSRMMMSYAQRYCGPKSRMVVEAMQANMSCLLQKKDRAGYSRQLKEALTLARQLK
jgi:hypothetical protein